MAITMCYCLGDLAQIVETPTKLPFIQVFFNATKSIAATDVMAIIMLVTLMSCAIKGSLFRIGSPMYVSPRMHIPLRAVFVTMCITCTVALINIGSVTALNAIISLNVVALLNSYYITIGCLVWRRLYGEPLPARRWSLGRYGLAVNIAALCFLTPIYFFAFWPGATPVTPENMNWAVVMYGGIMIFSLIYYCLRGKHTYIGPVVVLKRDS
ncbi:MAG: hypothetical protein Q9218_001346 [Villophora microphyllina]